MFKKLEELLTEYDNLNKELAKIENMNNHEKLIKYNKKLNELNPIIEKYKECKKIIEEQEYVKENIKIEKDLEMHKLLQEELKEIEEKLPRVENEIKVLLLPKDPNDEKNVIIEIRGGAGGDEAALFACALFRMFTRYSERKKWKMEIINKNEIGLGGLKEITFSLSGRGAYSKLKFESGVHRVQRVPETESSGRIHTSTVTVAVLPEIDDIKQAKINSDDLKIDTYRSGGAGGQHVNMTDSAVRITHLPTKIVVSCQDERSQLKNRDKAMKVLVSKLYELELEKQRSEVATERKLQVGTGARSEKIRTYNFPQGRVTDHRIKLTLHKLISILDGDLDELIDALNTFDQTERLKNIGE